MTRLCFALDLKNDPALIAAYDAHHQNVWPEIMASIKTSGIETMEIYRTGNRLFMIMETADDFSINEKAQRDAADPKVQEWEKLMWTYQQSLPGSGTGEKWVLMNKIFEL